MKITIEQGAWGNTTAQRIKKPRVIELVLTECGHCAGFAEPSLEGSKT
jgi:hypothetical protein